MRKTLIGMAKANDTEQTAWFNLAEMAEVEISSEDDLFPIEHALGSTVSTGWRASSTGPQLIRLRFDPPVEIHRIQIHVVERAAERMQEIGVFAEMSGGGLQEIRRQQFTFSPHGSTEEREDFAVDLAHVTILELRIDPDRSHDPGQSQHFATLASLKVA